MKLLEQLAVVAQRLRLSPNTIKVYQSWVKQFLTFSASAHGTWKHPTELGTADVEAFLNDLVVGRNLSASAQNQALCALVFLYGKVLEDVISIPSATASPPTCWRRAMTSARCSSFWGIQR